MIQSKPEEKFAIIREMTARDNNLLNIDWLCKIADVSRSGCYRWLKANKVAKNNVDRNFAIYGPRAVLLTDITYIPCGNGKFIYLSAIIDACTRQVLAYAYRDSLEIDFVLETVNRLIRNHGDTLNINKKTLFHSDQGSHHSCNKLIDLINDSGLHQSMSRKANCWDNAPQESFFGHMKDEIKIKGLSHGEICTKIEDWVNYYNNERYVWDFHKLAPNEYYEWLTSGERPLGGAAPESPELSILFSKVTMNPTRKTKAAMKRRRLSLRKTLHSTHVALQRCLILSAEKNHEIISKTRA